MSEKNLPITEFIFARFGRAILAITPPNNQLSTTSNVHLCYLYRASRWQVS